MESYTPQQIQEVKALNMLYIADQLGLQVVKQTSKGVYYQNPLRQESKSSFSIFKSRKGDYLAKDFGTDERAMDTITLVQKIKNISFQDAVKWLLESDGKENHSFSFTQNNSNTSTGLEIRKVQPLQNKALINYLKSRKININFASKCPLLFECYYRTQGKTRTNGRDFFALAFQNTKNGYDLRSGTFKGKFGINHYSYIAHQNSRNIAVFEGFMDYLSALTYYKTEQSNHHILILNSTENRHKALSTLQKFEKVFLYLDNDNTGRKTAQYFHDNLTNVFDQSNLYQNHTDLNDFLMTVKL